MTKKIKIFLFKIKRKFRDRQRKETFKSYGAEHSDKTFYIIRHTGNGGLFSFIISNIGRVNYAISRNFIPVVDMQNYYNTYHTKASFRKVNAWEFYFLQPNGYGLNDIKKAKNVILSDTGIIERRPRGTMECLNNEAGILEYWRRITSNYLIPNDKLAKHIGKEYNIIFNDNSIRILGVIIRGTDYTARRPKGHWVQPDVSSVIEKTYEVIENYNCGMIFLATEDIKIWNIFKEEFGEKLCTNNKEWVDYKGGEINNCSVERDNDNYLKGLEYFTTIYILSKCHCLIGGRAGGTLGAMIMSNGYEYQYFWDLGEY